jgi:hypothetical protein
MQQFVDNMNYGAFFSLFVLLLFLAASYGAGYLFSRFVLKINFRRACPELLINIALGYNLLALLTLGLGELKLLTKANIWVALSLFSIAAVCRIFLSSKAALLFFRKNSAFSILLAGLAVFTLGSALCLPYIWDELTYHIALPYRWIAYGYPAVFKDSAFSAFPAMPQLLFLSGCRNGGILFPRLLVWATYLLLFSSIYLYFKPYADRFTALFMVFMFIGSPLVINMMRSTYVEVFIMYNMLAALLLIRERAKSRKIVFLCGVLAGGAAAVKLTGIGTAVLIFIFLWAKFKRKPAGRLSYLLLYFLLGGIFMALPFYLRPWISTGNPFYPILASWFGGSEADIMVSEYWYMAGNAHFGLRNILGFFTVIIFIAFDGRAFDGLILGWAFIGFILLGIWLLRDEVRAGKLFKRGNIYLAAAILFFYIFWFMSSQQTRFLQPLLFLLLLAAIHGLRGFSFRQQKTIMIILALAWAGTFIYPPVKGNTIGSSSWLAVKHFQRSWRSLGKFSGQPLEFLKYATRDPSYVEAMSALKEKTPADAKIILLYERRGLYCPRPYVVGTPYLQAGYNTPVPAGPDDFYQSLRAAGIQYLLLGGTERNPDEIGGKYLKERERLMAQINYLVRHKKLTVIWGRGNYFLCRVAQ